MAQLQTMRQGKDTIDQFNIKFRVLVQKARLDEHYKTQGVGKNNP